MAKSSVRRKDIDKIMNAINDAIMKMGYVAVGYDNTGSWLEVIIDKTLFGKAEESDETRIITRVVAK